jgi:prevent-host-death family protein
MMYIGEGAHMHKRKTITELRSSLFETFDEVLNGDAQIVTHKNGSAIALVSLSKMEEMEQEIELHKNLAIGYAQALRGEGTSTKDLKSKMKEKEKKLRAKYG